jgi:hypothetical protein
LAALIGSTGPAGAVTGTAGSPATAAAATGFRSTGTLVVQATVGGSPLSVGGTVAVYRRGSLYRLDLLTLGFPGTDATAGAVASALIAPGGVTLLYDGATGTVSAYSTAHHAYYEQDPPTPKASGRAASPASQVPAAAGGADPLAALAGIARQLRDVERASIQLTGHSTTNGHATDDLDVLVRRQRPGKPLEDYHAQLALADDLGGFPVRILISSTPATPQDVGGSLRLDLTSVAPDTPDATVFAVPAGYARVASIGAVLQAQQ